MQVNIQKLEYPAHRSAGTFDNAKRWYPDDDIRVDGSFDVRAPSRAWPSSYFKHFYTKKFAQLLAYQKPAKYIELAGIDPESDDAKTLYAAVFAEKMKLAA